jgi:hypothetical protein
MDTPKRKMNPQLKIMGMLTVLFFGGVLMYTLLPEGPVRGMATAVFSIVTIYSMFKGL